MKTSAIKEKQKKVLKKLLENNGKSMGEAMREAGYKDGYSKNPKLLTNSKTWREIVEEMFPDSTLVEKHQELLQARQSVKVKGIPTESTEPDYDIQVKALDMAYKIKGTYAPEKIQTISPYDDMTVDELDTEIERIESQLNIKKNIV